MTQAKWVLDASALLAAIHNEKGGDYVQQHIQQCVISSINWSEVLQKLARAGADVDQIESSLKALGLSIIDYNEEDAHITASLWSTAKDFGLSLADRACIATGIRLKTTVITADKVWAKLKIDIPIQLIR